MFYYVFTIDRWDDPDDLRIVEDRGEALAFMKILGMRPRVLAK